MFQVLRIQSLLITLLFVGIYFLLRMIPDQACGLLHYEEVVNDKGEVEFCAINEAGFLDLAILESPINVELRGPEKWKAGETHPVYLRLKTLEDKILYPQDIAITHTEKLHLMVIDDHLEDYQHLHPVPTLEPGWWLVEITPKFGGKYHLFFDLVPVKTRRQVIARNFIEVIGEEAPQQQYSNLLSEDKDLKVRLVLGKKPLYLKQNNEILLEVVHPNGELFTLQKVMGDYSHLVAFDENIQGIGHLHPIPTAKESSKDKAELAFNFNTPNRGRYRIWAQLKVGGKERFYPFDLEVN